MGSLLPPTLSTSFQTRTPPAAQPRLRARLRNLLPCVIQQRKTGPDTPTRAHLSSPRTPPFLGRPSASHRRGLRGNWRDPREPKKQTPSANPALLVSPRSLFTGTWSEHRQGCKNLHTPPTVYWSLRGPDSLLLLESTHRTHVHAPSRDVRSFGRSFVPARPITHNKGCAVESEKVAGGFRSQECESLPRALAIG